ncbi:hypothetical protein HAX54_004965 [Datura stramonium]|uniref:Uncharacterized protein n=1 Tax=Datura stramonium TaxID=4076 RepID=A0ABS8T7W7_DATST|nr:hypothetical protein [Datura stramonium]
MTVGTTSTAMSMLFKGVEKIDVMIINVDSSNLISFQLLAHTVALDIISLCSEIMFGTDVGNARVNDYNLNVNMENNYKPALTFDSGYHHIQSDYNLDLDAVHGKIYSGSGIMFGTDVGNAIVNDYNLNVNMDNVTTYSGSTIMFDTYIGNMTINGLGAPNANFQQYFGKPNMSDPNNIIAASYEGDIVGSDSNEKENCDAYFNLNNMINLFQNLGPPSANRPNEQSSEFNQVCSDDQVSASI